MERKKGKHKWKILQKKGFLMVVQNLKLVLVPGTLKESLVLHHSLHKFCLMSFPLLRSIFLPAKAYANLGLNKTWRTDNLKRFYYKNILPLTNLNNNNWWLSILKKIIIVSTLTSDSVIYNQMKKSHFVGVE